MKITLASASPRRIELIGKLPWLDVVVKPSGADESTDKKDPKEAVVEIAKRKAFAVEADGLVLGADTMVAIGSRRLGKPHTPDEAREMFALLCGRTHSVLTGVCLRRGEKYETACEETLVEFGEYDAKIVENYIASGKPFDKAGGYGLQDEELAPMIKGIIGDYDNVLGLPVRLVGTLAENFT